MGSLLVFTENHAFGGGPRYLVDLVNAVSGLYDRVVISSNAGGLYPEDVQRLKHSPNIICLSFLTFYNIEKRISNYPQLIRKLILLPLLLVEPFLMVVNILIFLALLLKIKPSTVLCCNGGYPAAKSTLSMAIAARLYGVTVALSIISMPSPRRLWLGFYDGLLDKIVWRSTNAVIVNANSILCALRKSRELPAARGWVVYNGIENSIVIRRHPRIEHDSLVVGCVARMDREKGVMHLVDAFTLLCEKHRNIELVLAGQGNASEEIEKLVDSGGLCNKVRILGHFSGEVSELLHTLDVYAFPSMWEGFPYSILEAMQAGCAIVTTNVGGIPEAIQDGKEGLLVNPGSTEELFAAINRLLVDENLRHILAENAQQKYERSFTLKAMHDKARAIFIKAGLVD